jgi:hypothetical protein
MISVVRAVRMTPSLHTGKDPLEAMFEVLEAARRTRVAAPFEEMRRLFRAQPG